MSLRLDPVMQLVWAMANAEACAAGARRIEPAFFLVALLKVADEEFTKQIGEFSLPDSIKAALRRESMQMRRYLEASPGEITRLRRLCRRQARKEIEKPEVVSSETFLHRTAVSRNLFVKAAENALYLGAEAVTPMHLLVSLADSGILRVGSGKPLSVASSSRGARWQIVGGQGGTDDEDERIPFRFGPFIGRPAELNWLLASLRDATPVAVIVSGSKGCGKTALVSEAVRRLSIYGKVERPLAFLKGLSPANGAGVPAELEKRLKESFSALSQAPEGVFLLDGLDRVLPMTDEFGPTALALSSCLKTAARPCVVTTSDKHYTWLVKQEPGLAKLPLLEVPEIGMRDCRRIAENWANWLELESGIHFENAAIETALDMTCALKTPAQPEAVVALLHGVALRVQMDTHSSKGRIEKVPVVTKQMISASIK